MEEIKAQIRQLLGRPQINHSRFPFDQALLQDPKVLTAIVGFLVLLLAVYREFYHLLVGQADLPVTSSSKKVSSRGGPANVLLVGPVDAGKTSIFAKVRSAHLPSLGP
jgi:hypothetical protein